MSEDDASDPAEVVAEEASESEGSSCPEELSADPSDEEASRGVAASEEAPGIWASAFDDSAPESALIDRSGLFSSTVVVVSSVSSEVKESTEATFIDQISPHLRKKKKKYIPIRHPNS